MIDQILYDQHSRNCKVNEEIAFSIFHTEHLEKHNQLDTYDKFIFSKVLVDALLHIPITHQEKQDLYRRYKKEYQSKKAELQQINVFENKYTAKDTIRWFVDNSFIPTMLTKSLREENLESIFPFRFFIQDIQDQIDKNKYHSTTDVYRSQLMPKNDLQKFKESLQQFISINSFFWALHNRVAAMSILRKTSAQEDTERVLFEIHADGSLQNIKPFSCVKADAHNGPEEFLFSIGSIFRLTNIRLTEGNIWVIHLTLCANNDSALQTVMNDIHERFGDSRTSPNSFGLVLQHLNLYDDARKFYKLLIEVYSECPQRVQEYKAVCEQIYIDEANYDLPLKHIHDKMQGTLRKPKTALYSETLKYTQKGHEYQKKAELDLALGCYCRVLNIFLEFGNEDDPEVGRCFKHIASVYYQQKNYIEALNYYEKAKQNLEKTLPNHPDLSLMCINIGDVHQQLGQYDQAIEVYEKALDMAERISIPQWAMFITIRKKMASIYELKKDLPKALVQYEKIDLLLPTVDGDPHENDQNIQRLRAQIR